MGSPTDSSLADVPCSTENTWKKYYSLAALTRRRPPDGEQQKLNPVLGLLDLLAYGVSATVGAGLFAVAGEVARNQAGPAIVISILIAGFVSMLTGFCYLEFASQIPATGSGLCSQLIVLVLVAKCISSLCLCIFCSW